jgi:hypothetical protein
MKTIIFAAIRCSLTFTVTASLFSVQPAQAYTITLQEIGSNVVAIGSGRSNLTGLTLEADSDFNPGVINSSRALIVVGPPPITQTDITCTFYYGFTGPTNFGLFGAQHFPSAGS